MSAKKDYLITLRNEARSSGKEIAYGIYTLFLGDLQTLERAAGRNGQPITDAEVQLNAKRLIKSNNETIALTTNESVRERLTAENTYLQEFLPKLMSDVELAVIIANLKNAVPGIAMGEIMKHLKANHEGQYDGKTASAIIKEVLANG